MSQKIENQLNLALDITEEERQKSESLDIGYDLEEKEWELIVKYSRTLERVRARAVYVTELTGGYAIIQIKESQIKELAAFPEVEFIEKPKSLYFQIENGTMPVSHLNLITFSQKYIPAFIYTIFLTFDVFKAGTFLTLL